MLLQRERQRALPVSISAGRVGSGELYAGFVVPSFVLLILILDKEQV